MYVCTYLLYNRTNVKLFFLCKIFLFQPIQQVATIFSYLYVTMGTHTLWNKFIYKINFVLMGLLFSLMVCLYYIMFIGWQYLFEWIFRCYARFASNLSFRINLHRRLSNIDAK